MGKNEIYRIRVAVFPPLFFLFCMFFLFEVFRLTGFDNSVIGVYPRKLVSIHGVVTMVFAHSGYKHLFANSVPFFFLSFGLFYFFRQFAYRAFFVTWVISGVMLWIGGRTSYHIGASGLVYGLSALLFFVPIFSRNRQLYPISLIVVFLYGSMLWGILPQDNNISWEGHLFGLISGVFSAWYFTRNQNTETKLNSNNFDITDTNYTGVSYTIVDDENI